MTQMTKQTPSAPEPAKRRKAYRTPQLSLYGQVAALTQSGSNCTADNASCGAPTTTMGPMVSDRRAKQNLRRVGTHPLGCGLYLFDYRPEFASNCGSGPQFGVMADEVLLVRPEAVKAHKDGYLMVDYGMLGMTLNAR